MTNNALPITGLIDTIVTKLTDVANIAAGTIATTISPLLAVCFGIYIILMTANHMRGEAGLPIIDFFLKMAAWALIIGIGLNASNYTTTVIPIVVGIGDDIATVVTNGSQNVNSLDMLALAYMKIIDDGFAAVPDGIGGLSTLAIVLLKSAMVLLGIAPLLVAATITLVAAKVGSLLIAMVGPIFFGFALFPATRSYFSAWLNSVVSFALVPVFIGAISLISIQISTSFLANSSGQIVEVTFKDLFIASIINWVLIYLIRLSTSLASQLSGGGAQFSTNAGLMSAASSTRNSVYQSGKELKMLRDLMKRPPKDGGSGGSINDSRV